MSSEPRTLKGKELEEFESWMEHKRDKEDAKKERERIRGEREKHLATRPDFDEEETEELWEGVKPGNAIKVWMPDHGILTGLACQKVEVLFKKGAQKGELAHSEIYVFLTKPVTVVVGDKTEEVQLVNVRYGEVIKNGPRVTMPKGF